MKNKILFLILGVSAYYLTTLFATTNPNQELLAASSAGNFQVIDNLVKIEGADINTTDAEGRTPLMLAALYDKVSTVQKILEHNPKLDIQDKNGNTGLIHALNPNPHERITENTYKIIEILLEYGADPKIANNQNITTLELVDNKKIMDNLAHQTKKIIKRYIEKER